MTIRDLEIFVTVVEAGTMSAAAKKLKISQPSISQSIAQVEQEYNIILFDRISRKLFLTGSGKQLLVYAKNLLREVNNMKDTLLLAPSTSTFIVGASLSVDNMYLQKLMKEMESQKGDMALQCIIEDSREIEKKINNHELQVAILEGTEIKNDHWDSEVLFQDELYFICSKDHPFAHKKGIKISDLRNQPLAIREKGTNTRRFILSMLRDEMIPVELTWVCSSYETIFSVVEDGQAISLVPGCTLTKNKNVVSIPIEGRESTCNFYLVYRKDSVYPKIMESCTNSIRSIFKAK
ncbi:MAG: LysR family transcriptional regulator [Tissierellia bacterium]|nr:LysR family transcriptional regulator [Tissierellia bacterium]